MPRLHILLALLHRDYSIARSYRLAFASDVVFGAINLLIYFFISRALGDPVSAQLQGAPTYFAFAAVGVTISVVMQATGTGLARRVREEELTGTLETLVTRPISVTEMALGLAGFPFIFAMARAALYLLLAGVFLELDFSAASWPGLVSVLLVGGVNMTALGILLGALVVVSKRGEAIAGVVTLALGLFGGAFFPVEVLPGWLRPLGSLNPVRFAFDGARAALFRGEGWGQDLAALALVTAIGIPLAVWTFKQALLFARRSGSLSQY
jgi:ABC-2 type transport system permease protein